MSQTPVATHITFSYSAQMPDGRPFTGTIAAADSTDALNQLQALQLRVIQLQLVPAAPAGKPLRGDDFIAFNQQLAQLTGAGMPVEQGLRLIAQDMRHGRLAATVRLIVAELESGRTLAEAFERHRSQFPPLYARLVDAGVKSNNLSGILLNLGEYLELNHRLRAALWRELSYPIMVLAGMLVVLTFLSFTAVNNLGGALGDFNVALPLSTRILLAMSAAMPLILCCSGIVAAVFALAWQGARTFHAGRVFREHITLRVPLVGAIVRRNLVARWCDAVRLGVVGGLDLPASIDLATHALRSPLAQQDGGRLITLLQAGQEIDGLATPRLLPATVPVAMMLGIQRHDLPGTLASLRDLYMRQAQLRLEALPAILTPLSVVALGGILGSAISALFMPLLKLIQSLSYFL